MREEQIDQAERRETLENDRKLLEAERRRLQREGTTFHQFAQADAATPRDRFHQVTVATVIGSKAAVGSAYPAASAAHQTELPPEEPLGFSVDEMPIESSTAASPVEAQGDPTSARPEVTPLSSGEQQAVGSPLSSDDSAPGSAFPPGPARDQRVAESSPSNERSE